MTIILEECKWSFNVLCSKFPTNLPYMRNNETATAEKRCFAVGDRDTI